MNKKIIKYLIWTILITAILILMSNESLAATIKDNILTNENYFCVNKEYYIHDAAEVASETPISGNYNKNGDFIDRDVLTYLITETSEYGNKSSTASFVPQVAMWILTGSRKQLVQCKCNSKRQSKTTCC